MTNKNWFKGNGFLSEEGERSLIDFRYGLDSVMEKDEVRNMTVGEVQTLQSNLAKLVGDAFSKHLSRRLQEAKALESMSDKEVVVYLEDKYGAIWRELTLSPEEQVRTQTIRNKKQK